MHINEPASLRLSISELSKIIMYDFFMIMPNGNMM